MPSETRPAKRYSVSTVAGDELLTHLSKHHVESVMMSQCAFVSRVLAIEAEARAQERERLRALVMDLRLVLRDGYGRTPEWAALYDALLAEDAALAKWEASHG